MKAPVLAALLAAFLALVVAARAGWEWASLRAPFLQQVAAAPFAWHGPEPFRVDRRLEAPSTFVNQRVHLRLRPDATGLAEVTLRQRDREKPDFEVLVLSADPRVPSGFTGATAVRFQVPVPRVRRSLAVGAWADVAIEARGPRYRAFVDGELVDDVCDPAFVAGLTAFAVVSGRFSVGDLTVEALPPEPSIAASKPAIALIAAVGLGLLMVLERVLWRMAGVAAGPARLCAGVAALILALAWYLAWGGHMLTCFLTAFCGVGSALVARFALPRTRAVAAHVAGLIVLLLGAGVPLLEREQELDVEQANDLAFHEITGAGFPVDLAWYFHPLVRRFNSFLGDHTFRGRRHAIERPDHAVRIACMGTSSTWGYPLEAADAYPAQLESLLREQGLEAEVMNAAIPGSVALRLGLFFDGVVREFRPDVVTISLTFNDSSACVQSDEATLLNEMAESGFEATLWYRLRQSLAFRSVLGQFERARAWYAEPATRERALQLPIVRNGVGRFAKHLAMLVDHARREGARVLLIEEPVQDGAFLKETMHRTVELVGRSHDVPVLALDRELSTLGDRALLDWVHPSAAGHRLIATQIAAELGARGWLHADR